VTATADSAAVQSRAVRRAEPLGKLQTRLFLWLLLAIVLAVLSSAATVMLTASEPSTRPAQVMAKTIAAHLDATWGDPSACDAYVTHMREVTGFQLRLRRDPDRLPAAVQRAVRRGGSLAFEPGEGAFIPIVHGGAVVGAVEFESTGNHAPWWRLVVALAAALVVLGVVARHVSQRLAQPLERVAAAAERFGAGDLTVRTAIEGALERWVPEEVRNVAVAFDTMAEHIALIVRDQRELLAAISHELRSPLGRARIALEIARERMTDDPTLPLAQLDRIERELGTVDVILGDLLAVTRAGLSDLHKQRVTLGPWLRARLEAEPLPSKLEIQPEAVDTAAAVDAALLGRALHNVLENARAHGHAAEQPLQVRLERDGGFARIVVRDRGPGFAPDLLERAFEPFVRGDPARSPASGGSGLGLALVRRIAEAHGGRAFARNVAAAGDNGRAASPQGEPSGAEVGIELPAE
jgi:two-component system OmpR family sensor kinase